MARRNTLFLSASPSPSLSLSLSEEEEKKKEGFRVRTCLGLCTLCDSAKCFIGIACLAHTRARVLSAVSTVTG